MLATVFSIALITICMYGSYVCNMQNIKYSVHDNCEITYTYRRITKTGRVSCAAVCAKDPLCLAFNYYEEFQTCDLSSVTPDESIARTRPRQGSRLYFDNVKDLKPVSGIAAWQSTVYNGTNPGSLAIDGHFATIHPFVFSTDRAAGNFLIVQLEHMSNLVRVDILFRSDLPAYAIRRNANITVLVAHSKAELDTNLASVCGHYDGPPACPSLAGKVKCAPNTTGTYVKFLHNIFAYLNICEVSFYTK